jgi:hypothetical protein
VHVLTVRQPWVWAIFHAGKDVENRTWSTALRGRLAIHAGLTVDDAGLDELRRAGYAVPDELPVGVIVGVVQVLDCTRDHPSRWARDGHWHWALADPTELPRPVPHRGRPGLHSTPVDA